MEKDLKKLIEMIDSFNQSITILNQHCFEQQSLYLYFIYLDQLGWLISPNEFSTGSDFQNWIDTYCDLTDLECTSSDLWNTRCSLVHMGTPEHKHFNESKHVRLAFYQNVNLTKEQCRIEEQNYPKPTKLVDTFHLYQCINNGINKFVLALDADENLRSTVFEKVKRRNDLIGGN